MNFQFLKDLTLAKAFVLLLLSKVLIFGSDYSLSAVFGFAIAFLIYERYEALKIKLSEDALYDKNFVMIQNQIEQMKLDHEALIAIVEEGKKVISQANLAIGIQPKMPNSLQPRTKRQ